MSDPIIIDDGGSTRIRRIQPNGKGKMDDLLDVDDAGTDLAHSVLNAGETGSVQDIADLYVQIRITCQDSNGVAFTKTFTGWNSILIVSALGQRVSATKSTNGNLNNLKLVVFSGTTEPIVEAKSHTRKRRYVVADSGAILEITITDTGGNSTKVYTSKDGFQSPAGVTPTTAQAIPMIYSSVSITG